MRIGGALLGAGLLVGCGRVNETRWPERAARASCDFAERCAEANFFYRFGDRATCRAENLSALEEEAAVASAAGCVFDREQARACLQALGQSCRDAGLAGDALTDPCVRVWNCTDGSGSATGDTAPPCL